MRALLALSLTLALGAAPQPVVAQQGVETMSIQPAPADWVLLSFGTGRTLETRFLGPVGQAEAAGPAGGGPQSLAAIMDRPDSGASILGYRVTREAFNTNPLCPDGPTAAVAIMQSVDGAHRIAAITGGLPGEPGARVCTLGPAVVSQP